MTTAVTDVDPVLVEVIRNRLEAIVEEMEVSMIRAAYSAIIVDARDATAALFDLDGRILAQSTAIPAHLQMLTPATVQILAERSVGSMADGDVYITNDPYAGGTHVPDIAAVMPIFHDGRPVLLATTMAHHHDLGGRVPGSTSAHNQTVFEEGICLPVVNLYTAGRLEEGLLAVLCRNSRMPGAVHGDLMAQVASCKTGVRRVIECLEEFGLNAVRRSVERLLDRGEALARGVIEKIPDGTYSFIDYIDSDGVDPGVPVKIAATITVAGSDIVVDFDGSDPAAPGGINCVPSSVAGGALAALKSAMGTGVPNNEGAYRPISLVMPPGTIVNPDYPHAVGSRTIAMRKVWGVVQGALAKAVPEMVPAACDGSNHALHVGGVDPRTGRLFVTLPALPAAGGWGARPDRDGMSVQCSETGNLRNVPVEAFETAYPFRVTAVTVWADSGGAGRWRGGCGFHAFLEVLAGSYSLSCHRDRHVFAPWGLLGGHAAPTNRGVIHRATGVDEEFGATADVMVHEGDVLEYWSTGGGGYGSPLDREPWRVRDDVRGRLVSRRAAEDIYGVVFGPALDGLDGLDEVDEEATARRRADLRADLPDEPWLFDRGEGFAQFTGRPRWEMR